MGCRSQEAIGSADFSPWVLKETGLSRLADPRHHGYRSLEDVDLYGAGLLLQNGLFEPMNFERNWEFRWWLPPYKIIET